MFFRLRRMFRLVALASHFTKYLSKILKNPVQLSINLHVLYFTLNTILNRWGWEYDPDANFAQEVANPTNTEKTRNIVSAVDFAVGHLFSKNSYQGWLTPPMRTLFRKPPELRTDLELSELQGFCSTMKAFRKYPPAIQRELLKVGRYERWHSERMIVGENQKGMYFYVILDGEIEMFRMDREGMTKDKRSRSQLSISAVSSESIMNESKKTDDYERKYRIPLGSQTSGDSFGELAFVSGLRITSAITKKTTEFLLIERDDYLRIVQDTNDTHLREKLSFLKRIPLFKTLSANIETIALYGDLKSYPPESVVICEGDPCEYLYFLRSGSCRLIKALSFEKVKYHNGTYSLVPLSAEQQQQHYQNIMTNTPPPANTSLEAYQEAVQTALPEHIVTKFLNTNKLQ
ncbi:hypothetical protein HDU99_007986, partial [Rhizoclosmatium hyalinum]